EFNRKEQFSREVKEFHRAPRERSQNGTSSSAGGSSGAGSTEAALAGADTGARLRDVSVPPPSRGCPELRNFTFSAVTRIFDLFWLVCLSSQVSRRRRPSTRTGLPFFRYCPMVSAWRLKASMSINRTSSLVSPVSVFQVRLTASPSLATAVPLGV